jgi:hypothetical protein
MLGVTSILERRWSSVMSFTVAISIFILGGFALMIFTGLYSEGRRDLDGKIFFINALWVIFGTLFIVSYVS